jgi:hypothetical protein
LHKHCVGAVKKPVPHGAFRPTSARKQHLIRNKKCAPSVAAGK